MGVAINYGSRNIQTGDIYAREVFERALFTVFVARLPMGGGSFTKRAPIFEH